MTQIQKTPLVDPHIKSGAKMVDFGGWYLPINYGSQIKEHQAVRSDIGMFDVSHMLISDVRGIRAKEFFKKLLANDITKLSIVGKALYSAILNEQGGVIDDLIVYRLNEEETFYRIVSNGATREKDLNHFYSVAKEFNVRINPRYDLAMIAVQGPNTYKKVIDIYPKWTNLINTLKVFQGKFLEDDIFIAKTGYTGELGIEIMAKEEDIVSIFNRLLENNIQPCGLGARDTLRIEAGMNLYGHEMDDNISPLIAGMAWTVSFDDDRDFIGKDKLLDEKKSGLKYKQVGLLFEHKGILREKMKLFIDNNGIRKEGIITSGTFSPTIQKSIAIARVPIDTKDFVNVELRNGVFDAKVVNLPFVRAGKILI